MIHDLMLRWVVTGLFVLTAAECGLAIIAKRRPWTLIVNHGLHFAMAVAMAVMAWPWARGFRRRDLRYFSCWRPCGLGRRPSLRSAGPLRVDCTDITA